MKVLSLNVSAGRNLDADVFYGTISTNFYES
jgi:hypothetical protein